MYVVCRCFSSFSLGICTGPRREFWSLYCQELASGKDCVFTTADNGQLKYIYMYKRPYICAIVCTCTCSMPLSLLISCKYSVHVHVRCEIWAQPSELPW